MVKGKRVSSVPADETKAAKFTRLANGRYVNVVRGLRGLGKLGTSAYERTDEQVATLRKLILAELDDACAKLAGKGNAKAGIDKAL